MLLLLLGHKIKFSTSAADQSTQSKACKAYWCNPSLGLRSDKAVMLSGS